MQPFGRTVAAEARRMKSRCARGISCPTPVDNLWQRADLKVVVKQYFDNIFHHGTPDPDVHGRNWQVI